MTSNRDRLIELVDKAKEEYAGDVTDHTETDYIVETLLNNGVIVPPCKVGDKIYQTDGVKIYESTIMEMTFTTNKVVCCTENICFDETAIGESIFLTKEEAERELEKRGKENV